MKQPINQMDDLVKNGSTTEAEIRGT